MCLVVNLNVLQFYEMKVKEPVKLRRKALANGNVSLYLAIYVNGRREYEFLRLYLIPEHTREERLRNRNTLALANTIKAQRIVDVQMGAYGFNSRKQDKVLFFEYYKSLMEKYHAEKRKIDCWKGCLRHLECYEPRRDITLAEISSEWLEGFRNYLLNDAVKIRAKEGKPLPLSQNTKWVYFNKLRTVMKSACDSGIIKDNPMSRIKGISSRETNREYLSVEEVQTLAATDCDCPVLKRAFLFSCLTGLRCSDISRLTWGEVMDWNGRTRLVFRQKKTGGQEYLDIASQASELMGVRGDDHALVFDYKFYPSVVAAILQRWMKSAGIDKHITFHCARHTFAVMMLTLGTDIFTVSKLLGHRDLKTTQIYAKVVDAKKQAAVDNIPQIL